MKRWLSLALAGGLGVCLLLVLGRPEAGRGADNHPCLLSWARYAGPWGDPALPSPSAASSGSPRTVGISCSSQSALD
jgi:hypothetical protein